MGRLDRSIWPIDLAIRRAIDLRPTLQIGSERKCRRAVGAPSWRGRSQQVEMGKRQSIRVAKWGLFVCRSKVNPRPDFLLQIGGLIVARNQRKRGTKGRVELVFGELETPSSRARPLVESGEGQKRARRPFA